MATLRCASLWRRLATSNGGSAGGPPWALSTRSRLMLRQPHSPSLTVITQTEMRKMRLRVDFRHDLTTAGDGKALRCDEGDVEAFLGWGHVPTLVQKGLDIPEQFTRAEYVCDLEVSDDGVLLVHKERAFHTREKAKAWFRYV